MKKIGIMTTGGDCSGLNTAIIRLITGGIRRGYQMFGILDGTDGLTENPPAVIKFDVNLPPIEYLRMSGSFLKNGNATAENFNTAARAGKLKEFQNKLKKSIEKLNFDALILIGGNGSISLAHNNRHVYSNVQIVCIPKTIDMDIPLTDRTIGFDTAVQGLTEFCDQLMQTARSHHRWFVVQSMGRDTGHLALHSGMAVGASAILIPEIKFSIDALSKRLKDSPRDYGIIIVSEGVKLRGHSGEAADMVARELSKKGFAVRTAFPEHIQRVGDTTAADRILATRFADAALDSIENNETYVMMALVDDKVKSVPLNEMFTSGEVTMDPTIPDLTVSNSFVPLDSPLLTTAVSMGVYVGEIK